MHHHTVDRNPTNVHDGVQQAALFETVIGNILIVEIKDGIPRQQCVAVVSVLSDCIASVRRFHAQGGAQIFMLGVQGATLFVATLHFLEEKEIGVKTIQAQSQIM